MSPEKCKGCEIIINRKGERRPAIRCKDCKNNHCFQCAGMEVMLCEMLRDSGKEMWTCGECEAKNADLKSVLESIETIKKGQDDQQEERGRVLEGLKVMEMAVKNIEVVQAEHGERINAQEEATKSNAEKVDEHHKRLAAVEEKMDKLARVDNDTVNIRLTNAVVREIRLIEKSDTNFMVWNIPESTEEAADARKKHDENKVKDVLKEMNMEQVGMKNVVRSGMKGGRFPRKIKVILMSKEDCNKVMDASESASLSNNVRITRDMTYNQRQEARLFRLEKEEEGAEGGTSTSSVATQDGAGRGRGKGKGRPVGRPRGSGKGRGGRTDSRKRSLSGDEPGRAEVEDEENKRRKVAPPAKQTTPGGASSSSSSLSSSASSSTSTPLSTTTTTTPPGAAAAEQTPPPLLLSSTERQGTPHPTPIRRLAATAAAAEAEGQENF